MNGGRPGPGLAGAVAAAAEDLARALGRDACAAALICGDPPVMEVVHARGPGDALGRLLAAEGGPLLADALRRAGHPLRVPVDRLGPRPPAGETRPGGRDVEVVGAFPLLGETGAVGCVVVPADPCGAREAWEGRAWSWLGATPAGLVLDAAACALAATLRAGSDVRRAPPHGVLVLDGEERVLLADGLFRHEPDGDPAGMFGRPVRTLPGGEILASLAPGRTGELRWVERLLPDGPATRQPVALAALPAELGRPSGGTGRVVLVRERAAGGVGGGEGGEPLLSLAMRAAHLADLVGAVLEAGAPPAPGSEDPVAAWLARALERARSLVDEALARALSGSERGRADVNRALDSILDLHASDLSAAGVRLFRFQARELPPAAMDRVALAGALRSLLGVARTSIGAGGGNLAVRTWAADGWVHAVVSDDGAGRDPSDADAPFDPLFPATAIPTGHREVEAARAAVERAAGTLVVEERPGLWTRLEIRVPACAGGEAAATAPGGSSTGNGARPAPAAGAELPAVLDVLVVDDNAALRSVLRRYLERRGHRVTEATDGEDALALVAARGFDRLIVDVQMPVKDGPSFHRDLEHVAPELRTRTIFMTGGLVHEDLERSVRESGCRTVKKPFDLSEVVSAVEGSGPSR